MWLVISRWLRTLTPGTGDWELCYTWSRWLRALLHLEQVIDNCYTWSRWLKTLLHLEQVTENFATPGVGDCELCYTWIRSDFSLTCFTCRQMFYFWFIWLCFSSPSQSLSQLFCKNFNITFGKKTELLYIINTSSFIKTKTILWGTS